MPKRKKEVEDAVTEANTPPKKTKAKAKPAKEESTEPYVDENGWHINPPSLIYKSWRTKPGKRIAAFDFDGTLANTKSGAQFPRDANDWRLYNKKVPGVIQKYHADGYTIVIISNQGGIKSKLVGPMADKTKARIQHVVEKLDVPAHVFMATSDDDFRKPGTGMWDFFVKSCNGGVVPDLKRSFFVGDAGGRPGDFSDSDKKFAEAVGLDFKLPEDVFGEMEGKRALPPRTGTETIANVNPDLTDVFSQLAEHYSSQGEGFKARAFSNVVTALSQYPDKIAVGNLKDVAKLKGVGKASINIIKEFVETGKSTFLEETTGTKVDQETGTKEETSAAKRQKAASAANKSVALNFM